MWIDEPWMIRPMKMDEIQRLEVNRYKAAGFGDWGFISVGPSSTGPTLGYGSIPECQRRVAALKARLAPPAEENMPAFAGPGEPRPLF